MLYENQIEKIEKGTFRDQKKLERLDLSIINLVWWLKPMKQLKYLNLGNNIIKYFEPIMFQWPSCLEKISVKDNKFKIMPPLPSTSNSVVNLQNSSIGCLCKRHATGGCQEFLTVEGLRSISVCMAPELNINFKRINDLIIVQCKRKGFSYPEVQLRSSDDNYFGP